MSDINFWYDPETDQWTVKDGVRTETVSPFLREAFTDYHQREMQKMRTENEDLIDEAAAIREHNDRLREENNRLRLLVMAMRMYDNMPTDADPLAALDLKNAIEQVTEELGIIKFEESEE
jgi:hypothetical protein